MRGTICVFFRSVFLPHILFSSCPSVSSQKENISKFVSRWTDEEEDVLDLSCFWLLTDETRWPFFLLFFQFSKDKQSRPLHRSSRTKIEKQKRRAWWRSQKFHATQKLMFGNKGLIFLVVEMRATNWICVAYRKITESSEEDDPNFGRPPPFSSLGRREKEKNSVWEKKRTRRRSQPTPKKFLFKANQPFFLSPAVQLGRIPFPPRLWVRVITRPLVQLLLLLISRVINSPRGHFLSPSSVGPPMRISPFVLSVCELRDDANLSLPVLTHTAAYLFACVKSLSSMDLPFFLRTRRGGVREPVSYQRPDFLTQYQFPHTYIDTRFSGWLYVLFDKKKKRKKKPKWEKGSLGSGLAHRENKRTWLI